MKRMKIILTKKDYKFIDELMKKYKLSVGYGYQAIMEIAINEYKLKEKRKNELYN